MAGHSGFQARGDGAGTTEGRRAGRLCLYRTAFKDTAGVSPWTAGLWSLGCAPFGSAAWAGLIPKAAGTGPVWGSALRGISLCMITLPPTPGAQSTGGFCRRRLISMTIQTVVITVGL